MDRLADRNAAHPQPLGQVALNQAFARPQVAATNGRAQAISGFVAQGALFYRY